MMMAAAINKVVKTITALCTIHLAAFSVLDTELSSEPLSDLGSNGVRSLPFCSSSTGFEDAAGEPPIS
jgi:hypothetical protein